VGHRVIGSPLKRGRDILNISPSGYPFSPFRIRIGKSKKIFLKHEKNRHE